MSYQNPSASPFHGIGGLRITSAAPDANATASARFAAALCAWRFATRGVNPHAAHRTKPPNTVASVGRRPVSANATSNATKRAWTNEKKIKNTRATSSAATRRLSW